MEEPVSDGMRSPRRLDSLALAALLLATFVAVLLLLGNSHAGAAPGVQAAAPSTTCPCGQDEYEPDSDIVIARTLALRSWQQHSFHVPLDVDWFRFDNLQPGHTYVVETFDLTGSADTYIILHDSLGNPIKSNDDIDGVQCLTDGTSCASRLSWQATNAGPYYLVARSLRYSACSCPGYKIRLYTYDSVLPLVMKMPTLTPSPTPTTTNTPTPTVTPSSTPSPTLTPSLTPTPSSTPSPTLTITPGPSPTPTQTPAAGPLSYPQAVAVNSTLHVLYVTSRDNDRVYMLDTATLSIKRSTLVPDQPWGIAYFAPGNKVYVGSWSTGTVTVLDGTSLATLKTIQVGPNPTWVKQAVGKIELITYGSNGVVTIDPASDTVYRNVYLGRAAGAWSLAYNANLDLTYVSSRDSKTITVVDGFGNERTVVQSGLSAQCEPYQLDFNPVLNRLYVVCDVQGQRNDIVVVYQPNGVGLNGIAEITVGSAGPDLPQGEDGRGGLVVNPNTGSVFVSNSYDNTVSVIDGLANKVISTVNVGNGPFGMAVDTTTKQVFTANRIGNTISVFADPK